MSNQLAAPVCLALIAALSGGCTTQKINPSFNVTTDSAKQVIAQIQANPKPLRRPVVVLAGWADPGFVNHYWMKNLRQAGVSDDRMLGFSFVFKGRFDHCRNHVIEAVQKTWPSDDPNWTTEVDVVAFSMGGLVARYCAAPPLANHESIPSDARRLRIRNLYSISTPHLGAKLSKLPHIDRRVIDMRPGSAFLTHLDEALPNAPYTLTPYTRLRDAIVGEANTAPAGVTPWWVDTPPLSRGHQEAYRDPRIRADILRRLRGESPLTISPAAPLPR